MRKEAFVSITDNNVTKLFKIKQFPALKQERWINRVVLLLLRGGTNTNESFEQLQNKFANGEWDNLMGIFGSLKYEDVEPLYNELLECVEHVPNPMKRDFTNPMTAETIGAVIEDYKNLYRLRIEALKVNFDFFKDGDSSPDTSQTGITITKTTQTSAQG